MASDAWYPCFDRFAELLRHKNSLVRNRAIAILAAKADDIHAVSSFTHRLQELS